jgi:CO/xanthine dehydrogenase FAD-binding subunit
LEGVEEAFFNTRGRSGKIYWDIRRKECLKMVTFYRRLPKFDYVKPKSMNEALDLLKENRDGALRFYAGGTDLIPKLKSRLLKVPKVLVDLKGIPDLDCVSYTESSGLKIGALATISEVVHAAAVKEKYPILFQAGSSIASTQIQNRATIAGNICNAVPSADSAPALLCLGATVLCVSPRGERRIGLEAFFSGPNETVLNGDELVKEIQIPPVSENSKGVYIRLSPRSKMDLAVVGVAALVRRENGALRDVRIGLGAVAPTPMRAKEAEKLLTGEKPSDKVIEEAARVASEESKPIDDHRASAEYRRLMVEVLVKRAVRQIVSN